MCAMESDAMLGAGAGAGAGAVAVVLWCCCCCCCCSCGCGDGGGRCRAGSKCFLLTLESSCRVCLLVLCIWFSFFCVDVCDYWFVVSRWSFDSLRLLVVMICTLELQLGLIVVVWTCLCWRDL